MTTPILRSICKMITTEESYQSKMTASDFYQLERGELAKLIDQKGEWFYTFSRSGDSCALEQGIELIGGFVLTSRLDIISQERWHRKDDMTAFQAEPVKSLDLSKIGIPAGTTDFNTWFIEGDELVLKRRDWVRIDFGTLISSAPILDWIFHYQGRITDEELKDMIEALQAILHPMANYCSDGNDKKANGLDLLRKWLTLATPERKRIKPSLRFEILKRDNYRCQMCGVTAKDGATLEIDHITPVSKGGTNDADNLQVLCRDCNAGKSDQWQ
jgi:Restriction endonuclease